MALRFWRRKARAADATPVSIDFPKASGASGAATPQAPGPPPAPTEAHSYPPDNRQSDAEMKALVAQIKLVAQVWERAQRHELSTDRFREFRKRDEVAELIEFDRDELKVSAALTMKVHDGQLLLSDWLATATERRELHRERAAREVVKVKEKRRRCPACDMFEHSCICH